MAHTVTSKPILTFTDITIAETLLSMYDIELDSVESLKFLRVQDLYVRVENKLAPMTLPKFYAAIHNLTQHDLVEMKSEPYSSLTSATLNFIRVTELGQCEIPMLMNDYFDIIQMNDPLNSKPATWKGIAIAAIVGGAFGTITAWLTTLTW